MRENYGNNKVPLYKMKIYHSFLNRIKWFSTEEIIDINSYKELENTFGSDYFKLLTINGSFIPDSLLLKISDYFFNNKLKTKTIHGEFSAWKQEIVNQIKISEKYNDSNWQYIYSRIKEITVWEWLVASHLKISKYSYVTYYLDS